MPTIKYLHTTISKVINKELNIYFRITEINTDVSLFSQKLNKEKYLQFSNEYESFYFRNESDLVNESEIISVNIQLDDKILIKKRSYGKMNEVFFILGGYMQFLHLLFSILAAISNNIIPELRILNGIFNFNLKEKKMTLRIHSIKDFNSIVFKKNLYFPSDKQVTNLNTKIPNNNNNNVSKNSLIGCENDNNSSQVNIFHKSRNSLIIIKENENENEKNNGDKKQDFIQPKSHFSNSKIHRENKNNHNSSCFNNNNNNNNNTNNNTNNNNQNTKKNKYIYRVGSFFPKMINDKNQSSSSIFKDFLDQVYFNIFDYYCFKYCSRKKKDIEPPKMTTTTETKKENNRK